MAVAIEQMVAEGFATADEIEVWREEARDKVQRALAKAQQEPAPDPWHERWDARSEDISNLA
jgi:TPP-dependent pyruvate/acetoin dehydrogenase alpha subunit